MMGFKGILWRLQDRLPWRIIALAGIIDAGSCLTKILSQHVCPALIGSVDTVKVSTGYITFLLTRSSEENVCGPGAEMIWHNEKKNTKRLCYVLQQQMFCALKNSHN